MRSKDAYEFSWIKKAISVKMLAGDPINLLDIGCGSGSNLLLFHDGVGLDISVERVKEAKKTTRKDVILCDAHNLPIRDNSFSLVIMVEVIEHLQEPQKAILEARHALNNQGRILITTSNRLLTRGKILAYHIHEFTPQELIDLLKQQGFNTVAIANTTIPYIPMDNKFTSKISRLNRNQLFFEIWKILDRICPIKWDIIILAEPNK